MESTWTSIEASEDEQLLLRELGVKLARNRDAGGEAVFSGDGQRSVVHLRKSVGRGCEVRVIDAVGIVVMPSLILDVSPNIPGEHLLYLLERAKLVPRLDSARATLQADHTLFELIAQWYLTALDRVLEEGLARDYRTERGALPAARGRVLAMPTARLYYRGRLGVVSEYQDFDFDTPLNRLLLRAARLLASTKMLPPDVRAQARRATLRMDGIGFLRRDDLHAQPDRRTIHYKDAALLAKHLIGGVGRGLAIGEERVWTFLLRTPEVLEEGLRLALVEQLPAELEPGKHSRTLNGATMTLNPDLVFGEGAIADVKYKLSQPSWRDKNALYQLVAFATGFEVANAAIIDFQKSLGPPRPTVEFGEVCVTHLPWRALASVPPQEALQDLTQRLVQWATTWRVAGQ